MNTDLFNKLNLALIVLIIIGFLSKIIAFFQLFISKPAGTAFEVISIVSLLLIIFFGILFIWVAYKRYKWGYIIIALMSLQSFLQIGTVTWNIYNTFVMLVGLAIAIIALTLFFKIIKSPALVKRR